MKIIITESQCRTLVENEKYNVEKNYKAAVIFDQKYGTHLAGYYDFSPYSEDEIWNLWVDTRHDWHNGIKNKKLVRIINEIVPREFKHSDMSLLDIEKKKDILLGMVSGYNIPDIIWFSVMGIVGSNNPEQHELDKELPIEVVHDIGWVLSPESIKQIRNRFL